MLRLRFLKEVKSADGTVYKTGQALEVQADDAEALKWIADGLAEKMADPTPNPQGGDQPDVSAVVKSAVDDAIAKAQDAFRAELKARDEAFESYKRAQARRAVNISVGDDLFSHDPKGGYKHCGEFMVDVRERGINGKSPERLEKYEKAAVTKLPSGMNTLLPSEGGFLIPDEFRATLLEKMYEQADLLSRTTTVPAPPSTRIKIPAIAETSRADGSRQGGILVYRAQEAATVTATKPAFEMIELEPTKLMGLSYGTSELASASAIALESLIGRLFANDFAFRLHHELLNGTGAGQLQGIIAAPATVSVAKEPGQSAATIVFNNIVKMWSRLWGPSRRNAVWVINQDIWPQLLSLQIGTGTSGQVCFVPPSSGITGAPAGTIFGRPIVECEAAATLGTVGDIVLFDPTQYLYAPGSGGMRADSSVHVRFIYDEMTYRFTMYADGKLWWKSALTPFKGTNTQSPVITLANRA